MNDQAKYTDDEQQEIADSQVRKRKRKPQPRNKFKANKKAAKGRFHCGCGQSLPTLKDNQSVNCGSCGVVHHGPK